MENNIAEQLFIKDLERKIRILNLIFCLFDKLDDSSFREESDDVFTTIQIYEAQIRQLKSKSDKN